MRCALAFTLLASAAQAWEFTPGLPCRLSHETGSARIELAYDPTGPLYTITVTRAAPWPEAPVFQMRFDGPRGRTIGTDRHRLSADKRSLTVTDRGFGNVLDGLQYNHTATAIAGDARVSVPLDGAAGPVAALRRCDGTAMTS